MSCNANPTERTYPIPICAKSEIRTMQIVDVENSAVLLAKMKAIMVASGWTFVGANTYLSGAITDPEFVNEPWFQPRVYLEMSENAGGIEVNVSHTNNAFSPTLPALRFAAGSSYILLADPYSIHAIYTGAAPLGRPSFSMSSVHVNCAHRKRMKISCNVYATVSSAFLKNGYSAVYSEPGFFASKRDTKPSYSWQGFNNISSVSLVGHRTQNQGNLDYEERKSPTEFGYWVTMPVLVGWGDSNPQEMLVRGFMWNMLYFYGNLPVGTLVQYGSQVYYMLANHAGCTLAWRIT